MKWVNILAAGLLYALAFSGFRNQNDAGISGPASNRERLAVAIQKAQKEVPVLCFHHIHPISDRKIASDYIISEINFKALLQSLHDSGYHTVSLDQYYNFRTRGGALPSKPIILSFDDSHAEHYTIAAKEMQRYGYTGAFFIMTVVLGKPNYLKEQDIRALADAGHTIGGHTWDHHDVRTYKEADWDLQLNKQLQYLEEITGKPVVYFAYPYGSWNEAAINELKSRGIRAAFQLGDREHRTEQSYTLRRIIVAGDWSVAQLHRQIHSSFR